VPLHLLLSLTPDGAYVPEAVVHHCPLQG